MSLINFHQCLEYIPIPHLLVLDNDTPKFAIKRLFQLENHHDSMHTSVSGGELYCPAINHFFSLLPAPLLYVPLRNAGLMVGSRTPQTLF